MTGTVRAPLVLVNGKIVELPTGDYVGGAPGENGVAGADGVDGNWGGATTIPYTFDTTTTDADPGNGKLRLNNATQSSATAMYLDLLDNLGTTWTNVIDTFDDSTNTVKGSLRLVKLNDATKWLTFNITAWTTATGYRKLTLTNTGSSASSPFANNDSILLCFDRAGDAGTNGTNGTGVPSGGTTGQVLKKNSNTDYDTVWGTATGGSGVTSNSICSGRLTLASGTPVTTTDQTGKTTVYFTPYKGNQISLYDGASWSVSTFSEISIALGTLTSGKAYDVFAYDNSGTVTLELSAAWASDTARTDAIVLQDGVYVKSSAKTRRYLGTFYTTSTTTTEDSQAKRYLYNVYNQVRRSLKNTLETTDSWSYATATWRQANANSANQVNIMDGLGDLTVDLEVNGAFSTSSSGFFGGVGVGVNSTSTNSANSMGQWCNTALAVFPHACYSGVGGLGRNYYAWLEMGQGSGTNLWYGDNGTPTTLQSGMCGSVVM